MVDNDAQSTPEPEAGPEANPIADAISKHPNGTSLQDLAGRIQQMSAAFGGSPLGSDRVGPGVADSTFHGGPLPEKFPTFSTGTASTPDATDSSAAPNVDVQPETPIQTSPFPPTANDGGKVTDTIKIDDLQGTTPQFPPEAFERLVEAGQVLRSRLAAAGLTIDGPHADFPRAEPPQTPLGDIIRDLMQKGAPNTVLPITVVEVSPDGVAKVMDIEVGPDVGNPFLDNLVEEDDEDDDDDLVAEYAERGMKLVPFAEELFGHPIFIPEAYEAYNISNEIERIYHYADGTTFSIADQMILVITDTGGHRIIKNDVNVVSVRRGWQAIEWVPMDDYAPLDF